ncbi:MAG TPA: SH3 domain-containing protein [Clostridia bacterium]
MKRFFLAVLGLLYLFLNIGSLTSNTLAAENLGYGLIVESNSVLYRNPIESDASDNIYFYLPETYFVEILEQTDQIFYKVRYDDIVGYVKFSAINIKDYEPVSAFPVNLFLTVSGDLTANVRALPDSSSTLIASLPSGTSVQYYNKIHGQELKPGSPFWYCIKLQNGPQVQYGYIYAEYVTVQNEIIFPNDISPKPVSNPAEDPDEKLNETYNFWTQLLIALAICIPVVFLIYIIFKPRKA